MNKLKGTEKIKLPLITALIIIASLGIFSYSYFKAYEMMEEISYERLNEATETAAADVSALFRANESMLNIASSQFAGLDALDSYETRKALRNLSEEITASRVSLLLPDDRIVTIDGVLEPGTLHFEDVAKFGNHFSRRDTSSLYTNETIFRQYAPVRKEGKVIAVLYAVYGCTDFRDFFSLDIYGGEADFFLIDRRDGNVVANTYNGVLDNINDRDGESLEERNESFDAHNLLSGGKKCMSINRKGTDDLYYVSYAPTDFIQYSIVISILGETAMDKVTDYRDFIIIIGIAESLLFILYGIWVFYKNHKDIKRVTDYANKDALTKVGSVLLYSDDTVELDRRIKEGEKPRFAIVECDLNNLKKVNDTHGHDAGNEYIIRCSKAISSAFPHSRLYRIGGDEFVLILEGEDYKNRESIMKKLHSGVMQYEGKEASFASGMSEFMPESDHSVGDVLKRADKAMYENKREMKAKK